MIFKSLQNIETAFKLTRVLAIAAIVCSAIVVIYNTTVTAKIVEKQREKIYVLDRGKSLILALQQDMAQNRPVEIKNHVSMFHELFFTVSPDADLINRNIKRAINLADKTVYNYYNDLREAGYYRRIISANIMQQIVIDSVVLDVDNYPYSAITYTQQIIRRESNITRRQLVTTCNITNCPRSDNNPHGCMIENFVVQSNKDINQEKR